MRFRYIAPVLFAVSLAATSVSSALLAVYPGSTVLWWINQEVYCRLRALFYLLEPLGLGPLPIAVLMMVAAACFLLLRRNLRMEFLANHVVLVAMIYAGLVEWSTGVVSLDPHFPVASLFLRSELDWPLAIGVLLALLSTLGCHWRYLKTRLS